MKTKLLCLRKLSLYFLIGLALTLIACSGEDGMDGETGPAGKDGNANVIVSDWMPIIWDSTNNVDYATMFISVPGIMDLVENGGIANLYLKEIVGAKEVVYTLPLSSNTGNFSFTHGKFSETNEGFEFIAETININLIANNPDVTVRYVLIPANVVETTGLSMKSDIDFEETMELLGIDR